MKIDNSMKFFVGDTAATKILLGSTLLWPLIVSERNKIIYTSTDGNIVTPYKTDVFGANIISNEYEGGIGVIIFDGDVTMIGKEAFYCCESLTSVYIPDGVTTIGDSAFYLSSLTSVTIPDGVTTIGEYAFGACHDLASVTIPDSVTSIGEYAFGQCTSITSVTIPDGVTSIENNTFSACYSLTSVTIPDSVTMIGVEAFYSCWSLTSVTIPDRVTTIGERAFNYCNSLKSVYCKASLYPRLGGTYVFDANSSSRKIYVPYLSVNTYKSATNWSEYADAIVAYDFENAEVQSNNKIWYISIYGDGDVITPYKTTAFGANIISNTYENGKGVITFDGDVTMIGKEAFYNCDRLRRVYIPDSVTSIGGYAFNRCTELESVTIPDSVTTIGTFAFWGCEHLTSVTIPKRVTEISSNTFSNCTSLRSVTIPDSVKWILTSVFSNCTSLTSVTIPDSVMEIGDGAFERCTSLTSATIGNRVTTIGDSAFYNCTSLTRVYCKATTPPSLGDDLVFDANSSSRKIYVPTGSVNTYKIMRYWDEYASAIVGYNF